MGASCTGATAAPAGGIARRSSREIGDLRTARCGSRAVRERQTRLGANIKLHAAGDAGPGLARHFCSPGCCPGAGRCEEVPAESILPAGFDVQDIDSHSVRALLASRALLVKIKRDLENHVRGLLKNLGLVIGRAKFNVFAVRAEELIEGRPELIAAIRPLLEARNAVGQQVSELDRKVMKLARHDAQVRRLRSRHLREDLRGCIPPKSQSPRPSDPDGSSRQTRRPLTGRLC